MADYKQYDDSTDEVKSNLIKFKKPTAKRLAKLFGQIKFKDGDIPKNTVLYNETVSNVRAVAEFEDMGGVIIGYPGVNPSISNGDLSAPTGPRTFGIPNDLIIKMQQADKENPNHIFILCGELDDVNKKNEQVLESLLLTHKLNPNLSFKPEFIHFIPVNTDTYWSRDFGPWWIENNNKDAEYPFSIAKHVYTTEGGGSVGKVEDQLKQKDNPLGARGIFRPNDDYAAVYISDYLNAPIIKYNNNNNNKQKKDKIPLHNWYFTGLLDVGGNYMVNGNNELASSYLVARQNNIPTNDTWENRMKYILDQCNKFLGINTYQILVDPTGTYIGHIDCWGKYLSKDIVLIAQVEDKTKNDGLNKIAQQFEKRNYTVYRVLCQRVPEKDHFVDDKNTAAYTNSLILNKCVYIAFEDKKKYAKYNQAAIDVYKKALPDYEIIGIYEKPQCPWLGTDALHCRTRGIPRKVVDNWYKAYTATDTK